MTAAVETWRAEHQSATSDAVLGVHSYYSDSSLKLEPDWTTGALGDIAPPGQSLRHTAGALFFADDGGLNSPLAGAPHEYGHVLGLAHAGQLCGGNQNGQIGEPWTPINDGELQGVKWDRTQSDAHGDVDPVANSIGLYDIMSYCSTQSR